MRSALITPLALAFVAASLSAAHAGPVGGSLSVTYYKHSSDGDFQNGGSGAITDLVTSTLGADGLPVFNAANAEGYTVHDVNAANEIQWWTLSSSNVANGSSTVSLPYSNSALYPPAGTGPNDLNGFQTAVFTGTFNLATASQVSFSLGADDDAFFYVDGTIVSQLGGIHGNTVVPVTTSTLAAGNHTIELFYADRHTTGASLSFGVTSQGIVINPIPEPAALALLGSGLLGLAALRRRAG